MLTFPNPIRTPVIMRSRLMLEVASELVAANEWAEKQTMIYFRVQGASEWKIRFFASDAPGSVDAVANHEADIAICNPGSVLAMAARGRGPWKKPLPLRSIMALPQFDQLGFAVKASTGLKTLADLKRTKYPLKISLRGQPDHSVHLVCNCVLAAYGMSLEDIQSWGGKLVPSEGLPNAKDRIGAVERGEVDALWDEALPMFADRALELGMRFLAIDEPQLKALEADGLKRAMITRREFPALPEDVPTLDFSGWPVFCLDSAPEEMIYKFCEALEARKDRIPWYGNGPMALDKMCKDTVEGPLYLPLHPGAARFWKERGYI
ncbi:MAG TPA: TAXI family TRAP transporter solute-binding subunit [Stellaceae bacterium]|nr:TAXI family TRAP transporter solute-binding subunit [Stellaceae bacterium]